MRLQSGTREANDVVTNSIGFHWWRAPCSVSTRMPVKSIPLASMLWHKLEFQLLLLRKDTMSKRRHESIRNLFAEVCSPGSEVGPCSRDILRENLKITSLVFVFVMWPPNCRRSLLHKPGQQVGQQVVTTASCHCVHTDSEHFSSPRGDSQSQDSGRRLPHWAILPALSETEPFLSCSPVLLFWLVCLTEHERGTFSAISGFSLQDELV